MRSIARRLMFLTPLLAVVPGLLAPSPAAAGTVTVKVLVDVAPDGTENLHNRLEGAVWVDSTESCRYIQLLGPGVTGGAQTKGDNMKRALFMVAFTRPTNTAYMSYFIRAECHHLFSVDTSNPPGEEVKVKAYVPPPPKLSPSPTKSPPAGNKKKKKAAKNGAASKKKSSPRLATWQFDLSSAMSSVFGAMAAREFDAARLLALTGDLPTATGPVNQAPAVAPAPPMPALPALLTPAARADVEAAFRNVGEQIQYGTAALEALARMNDASLAGDAASVTLQEAAAADLLDRWAGALGGGAAARKLAQDALALAGGVGPVTFTAAEAEQLVADAVNGIYPSDLAAGLDGMAASPGTRALAAVALAELKPTDLVNYTPTLIDAEQAQAEANAVAEMRALALSLRTPGDGPGTDPVAGRSEKAGLGSLKPVACVANNVGGCAKAPSLSNTAYVTTSADGRWVYVASRGQGPGVTGFARDPVSGKLTPIKGKGGCVAEDPVAGSGCTAVDGLGGASGMAVSPDGKHVYVASPNGSRIVALTRDRRKGTLKYAGCIADSSRPAPGARRRST